MGPGTYEFWLMDFQDFWALGDSSSFGPMQNSELLSGHTWVPGEKLWAAAQRMCLFARFIGVTEVTKHALSVTTDAQLNPFWFICYVP